MENCLVHVVIDYICINVLGITGAGIAVVIVYLVSGAIGWDIYIRYV